MFGEKESIDAIIMLMSHKFPTFGTGTIALVLWLTETGRLHPTDLDALRSLASNSRLINPTEF
jgi:hypothetical protein